jgi:predicted Rdx family selenoprotein
VRTVSDLLTNYQHVIEDLRLVMGSKGIFDVEVDGQMLFSKHAQGRHAGDGEVLQLFTDLVGPNVPRYE